MALTLTTLPLEDTTAKTFTLIGRDKTSASWFDATDNTATSKIFLNVKQQLISPTKDAAQLRRVLANFTYSRTVDSGGTPLAKPDLIVINTTITKPENFGSTFATLSVQNLMAMSRGFLTAAIVAQLLNGEV